MNIVLLAPYGSLSRESGVAFLLANYLKSVHPSITALRCNGAFSICDRDSEQNWHRKIDSCSRCISNQSNLANWAGVRSEEIARFLSPDDIEETKRFMLAQQTNTLIETEYQGLLLFDLVRGSFTNRFGVGTPNVNNKHHEYVLRRLMLSAARMVTATKKFNSQYLPSISLVCGGDDFISKSFEVQSRKQQRNLARLSWHLHERCVKVTRSSDGEVYSCALAVDGIDGMRQEAESWPREVLYIIREILAFLDISEDQLSLPMAR